MHSAGTGAEQLKAGATLSQALVGQIFGRGGAEDSVQERIAKATEATASNTKPGSKDDAEDGAAGGAFPGSSYSLDDWKAANPDKDFDPAKLAASASTAMTGMSPSVARAAASTATPETGGIGTAKLESLFGQAVSLLSQIHQAQKRPGNRSGLTFG